MVVMIADEQILPAQKVCQSCLMSDHHGLPRWHGSQLGCGKILPAECGHRQAPPLDGGEPVTQTASRQATIYRCQMGFNITQVN